MQITNLSPIIAFYHALVGAAAMLTCVATYMDHFPHIAEDPVRFLSTLLILTYLIDAN